MATERMKEIRDWINLAMTAFTVIAIPIGIILLRNQKLEIKQDVATEFVSKPIFGEYREQHQNWTEREHARVEARVEAQKLHTDKVEAKLDAVNAKVDAITLSLTTVQAELRMLNSRSPVAPAPVSR